MQALKIIVLYVHINQKKQKYDNTYLYGSREHIFVWFKRKHICMDQENMYLDDSREHMIRRVKIQMLIFC